MNPSYIFDTCIAASALVVLVYIFFGGLSSAIYNEVLQFFLIVAGFLPLVYLGVRDAGGWRAMQQSLPSSMTHSWQGFGSASTNAMGVDAFGVAMGLGFVLSFGYWCTDFLVVQRAMAANSMAAARRTPLIAAFPKMLFPLLVVLPGLIALSVPPAHIRPGGSGRSGGLGPSNPVIAIVESPEALPSQGLIPYKLRASIFCHQQADTHVDTQHILTGPSGQRIEGVDEAVFFPDLLAVIGAQIA